MSDAASISVIIPNHNGEATIGECLKAAFASELEGFEVVVVDDASTDDSVEIIKETPAKLIELKEHAGVSVARNTGARNASGDILLFIDADCLLEPDALSLVERSISDETPIIGGTYTKIPHDSGNFFSTFQSIFINYNETRAAEPDYIAAHCLAIKKEIFEESGGFIEDSYMGVAAGVEDVELSHRLRGLGHKLKVNPNILVCHIFNFTFSRSMKNAFKKSKIWTMYLLATRGAMGDSGTASAGLKLNVLFYFSNIIFVLLYIAGASPAIILVPFVLALNVRFNRGLEGAFHKERGPVFAIKASAYYFLMYPVAVGLGAFAGILKYIFEIKLTGRHA